MGEGDRAGSIRRTQHRTCYASKGCHEQLQEWKQQLLLHQSHLSQCMHGKAREPFTGKSSVPLLQIQERLETTKSWYHWVSGRSPYKISHLCLAATAFHSHLQRLGGKGTAYSDSTYGQSPPPNLARACRVALREKLVEAVLRINTQIQLAWLSVDRLSHHR